MNDICGSCGSATVLDPNAVLNSCGSCGHTLMGPVTPPVENLPDLCPICRHSLAAEHSDLGCNIPGCDRCPNTGAGAIDQIQAVLPNGGAAAIEQGKQEALEKTASAMPQYCDACDRVKAECVCEHRNANSDSVRKAVQAFEKHIEACKRCVNLDSLCPEGKKLWAAINPPDTPKAIDFYNASKHSGKPCSCGHQANQHADTGSGDKCAACDCDVYDPVATCKRCGEKERDGVMVGGLCEDCQENKNVSKHELAAFWDRMDADEIEGVLGHGRFTVDVQSGKPHPFVRQPSDIQRDFKASFEDAHENRNSWTDAFLKRNPDFKSRIEPKLKAKWDGASDEQRRKWADAVGSGSSYSEAWDTIMRQGGSTAESIMEKMAEVVGERINSYGNYNIEADLQRGLSVSDCAKKLHERYPDIDIARAMRMVEAIRVGGATAKVDWTKGGERKNAVDVGGYKGWKLQQAGPSEFWATKGDLGIVQPSLDKVKSEIDRVESERGNARPGAKESWERRGVTMDMLKTICGNAGVDERYATYEWNNIPGDVQAKLEAALLGPERKNSGDCEACKKALGLGSLDAYSSSDIFTKDHRFHVATKKAGGVWSAPCGEQLKVAENANAAPDFKKALAAFEAHAKSCAQCRPVWEATDDAGRDPSKLCATGSQLLVADLGNAGPEGKCACGQPKRDQDHPDFHTPNSDRCKQLQQKENAHQWKCPKCGSSDTEGGVNAEKAGELGCKKCGHRFMDFEAVQNAADTCADCGGGGGEVYGDAPDQSFVRCKSCGGSGKAKGEKTNSITPEQAKKALEWIKGEPLGPAVKSMRFDDGKDYTVAQLEAIARGERQNGWVTSEKLVTKEGVRCPRCGDNGRLVVSEKTGICEACLKEDYERGNASEACNRCTHSKNDHAEGKSACGALDCPCSTWEPPLENANAAPTTQTERAAVGASRYGSSR